MLQNVSKNYDVKEEKIDYKNVVVRIFKIQNIMIYILTFMMSMVGFGVDTAVLAPFGIAMVAASISNGLPIVCVYVASLLGTAIRFGGANTVSFIFSSIIMLLLVLIKKPARNEDENEKIRLGSYLFISIILVQAIYMIFKGFYFYDLLVTITMGVASYIFYKIFVNSIDVISKYGIKKIFSIEEVIGASLIFAIASISLSNVQIFSFSLRNIICIFIVLLLGWRNGILVGGISGITIGIVLGIIGDGNPILIATYAISGMLAGLLNRFGKIGVIIGFILGNILIAYSANGGTANIIVYQEILIASIGLLTMPKNSKININELIPQTKMLPEAGRTLDASDETLIKLNSISKTISDIANNYKQDELYEKNETSFEEEIIKALDGLEDNLLYDYIYNNEDNILRDIFDYLIENGILTQNAIISIFSNHNIYLMNSDNNEEKSTEEKEIREMLNAINSAWRICKTDLIWQKKLDDANKNMSDQLKTVKTAIENITEDFVETGDDIFKKQKEQIVKSLKDKNINLIDIKIRKEPSGRFIVNTYTKICEDEVRKSLSN